MKVLIGKLCLGETEAEGKIMEKTMTVHRMQRNNMGGRENENL